MSDSCQPYFSLLSSLFDTFAAENKFFEKVYDDNEEK